MGANLPRKMKRYGRKTRFDGRNLLKLMRLSVVRPATVTRFSTQVCPSSQQRCTLFASGNVIRGLFAAGEITGGSFFNNYPGGSGLMKGAVFGRLAGTSAAEFAKANRA